MFSLLKLDVNETVLRTYLLLLPFPSLVAQMVKNLPAMQETWVWTLGWEDSLEEGMATPLQCSCLESPYGLRTWATFHEIAKTHT